MKFDLEDRLIDFVILISEISEKLPPTNLGKYISAQMVRSGTSPALNYGEAQAAESTADFIHKLKIGLKELRETFICLKIIERKPLLRNLETVLEARKENNELISIFVSSISTAKAKLPKKGK